jgi:hypothetical protein
MLKSPGEQFSIHNCGRLDCISCVKEQLNIVIIVIIIITINTTDIIIVVFNIIK